ncbi:MAG: cell filamentation protein Fic [Candidatus Magasanikbacteria bacterium CG11_big_fil_rev_8_21_14_0_20_43_7]|uniref:Fic family protein n=2 Tax=Candidatus Magasanikiibacteriota TaxID=1752731 RepID=A0A2M6P0C2_9BACT|nr:MAG: cell filamentation protein Fic [Candidatus Magasanikbacteria bacterium CG11_big_fil_rev_8_21_14_0_20_43_7]PIR77173.1 MAG: Fic family protein [Candidatus Magasanikbacteria bacterium CG10_big_fil_rev_8_21_14_0_10_38_6]
MPKKSQKNSIVANKFTKRLDNIHAEIISKIAKIDELKGSWITGAQLSPQALGRLKRSVLITSTGASTRIEGVQLSDEEIEKVMRGIHIQKFADRDTQEVKGYYELLENIFNSWESLKCNESSIKHFHKELLKYSDKDQGHLGDYKFCENKVVAYDNKGKEVGIIFHPTSPHLTSKEMMELVESTNFLLTEKKYHPLLIVANFLVEFLAIHPFQDGNGRISRVLTNLLLLQSGYVYMPYVSHEKFVENNKTDYYLALRHSQKTFNKKGENITSWLDFFLTILLKQSQLAIELLSKENIEKLLSEKQLAVWKFLQHIEIVGTGEIATSTNIPRPTVKQALDVLLKLKKIERIGQGRSTRYKKV